MESNFFAMMSRMKFIERWALMRNARQENLSEHALEVSMLAHALAVISNERLGSKLNVEKAALMGIYHDAAEIITGDMPTPIKYFNADIQGAFKEVEKDAAFRLYSMLPDYMKKSYGELFFPSEQDAYLWRIVKAADKLSALIKCMEEEKAGNTEFLRAKSSIRKLIDDMELKEVDIFIEDFLPAYGKTLDELN